MDAAIARMMLLRLPYVVETAQWGDALVFWVCDKRLGGRMFALLRLDAAPESNQALISFAAGAEAFNDLLEIDGLMPAPYLARAYWVAATHWQAFQHAEWEQHFARAHSIVTAKLSRRTQAVLELPVQEQRRLLAAANKAASTGRKSAVRPTATNRRRRAS